MRPAGLVLLALSGAAEAAERTAPRASDQTVDAEMLRDLDLLVSPDYARDREVMLRMGLLERLRLLESPAAGDAAQSTPARSEVGRTSAPAKEPR
jgi:hypothetical protein